MIAVTHAAWQACQGRVSSAGGRPLRPAPIGTKAKRRTGRELLAGCCRPRGHASARPLYICPASLCEVLSHEKPVARFSWLSTLAAAALTGPGSASPPEPQQGDGPTRLRGPGDSQENTAPSATVTTSRRKGVKVLDHNLLLTKENKKKGANWWSPASRDEFRAAPPHAGLERSHASRG